MKTSLLRLARPGALLTLLTVALIAGAAPPAAAQIRKMSHRELRTQTSRAERQARRAARKAHREDPTNSSYLDMSVYNMKPGAQGHKRIKATDGRDNYQFTRAGEPMVTSAPTLTNKRLKRKK